MNGNIAIIFRLNKFSSVSGSVLSELLQKLN